MQIVEFPIGYNIMSAAEQLVVAAAYSPDGKARGKFNRVMIVARKVSTVDALVNQYHTKLNAQQKKYWRTAAAKAEASRWTQHKASVQKKHDELMRQLSTLDFASDVSVLTWLCEYQNPSDFRPVTNRDPHKVVRIFAEHDYHPNQNLGDDFRKDDRENHARYIIGQALDCLIGFGSIHQAIHHYVDNWKKQFITVH